MNSILDRILPSIGSLARRWESRFYVVLAVALGLFVIVDFSFKGIDGQRGATVDDRLLKWRLASPAPSPDILIVDIDERSLERVGREQGRWPWTRAVLAEALANVSEAGPKAVLLNVHVSERDTRDPAGDEALAEVAAAYDRIVFPFIRLAPSNDAVSQLEAASIPGVRPSGVTSSGPSTVAAVMPMFESLQRNTGASNLLTDRDGIVRRYQYWLPAGANYLPSTVVSVVRLAGGDVAPGEEQFSKLNWRNKRGDYTRVSFADLYEGMRGSSTFDWSIFKEKIVIIGASAPGISSIKPTAVSSTRRRQHDHRHGNRRRVVRNHAQGHLPLDRSRVDPRDARVALPSVHGGGQSELEYRFIHGRTTRLGCDHLPQSELYEFRDRSHAGDQGGSRLFRRCQDLLQRSARQRTRLRAILGCLARSRRRDGHHHVVRHDATRLSATHHSSEA